MIKAGPVRGMQGGLSKAELARVRGRSIFSLLGWGSSPVRHTPRRSDSKRSSAPRQREVGQRDYEYSEGGRRRGALP